MIRRIIFPALLFSAIACTTDRPAQTAAPPEPASRDSAVAAAQPRPAAPSQVIPDSIAAAEPPVAPLPPAPAYLVWTADSSHAPVTVWIDSLGREVARRRGMYAAAGARLWRWTEGTKRATGLDCACTDRGHDLGDCQVTRPVEWASLAEVGGSRRLPLMELEEPGHQLGEAPPHQHAYPVAGVGPYLFHAYDFEGSACGAHGWYGTGHQLADLRQARLLPTDTVRYTATDSAAALDTLIATDWGDREGVRDGNLYGVEAEWAGDSALRVILRFALDAPYGMGDGAGYFRTVTLATQHSPRWLAPYVSTPEAVRRYWRRSPRREHAGWSAVDADHAIALLARFRAR